jgi:phenylalanyl-tRNA synthetase beta chain
MLPGLVAAARFNLSYGADAVALFETARVFVTDPWPEDRRLPNQVDRLSWVVVGDIGPSTLGDSPRTTDAVVSLAIARLVMDALGHTDYDVVPESAPGFHPARSAAIRLRGTAIGHVGELAPRAAREFGLPGRVAIAELDLAPLLAPVDRVIAVAPSVFPHVDFDLSFLVPGPLDAGALVRTTVSAGSDLVESARVFDEFLGEGVGEGNRALAIRYRLRASDHTLTNEEVAPVREAMIRAAGELGARLRGA